MIGANRVTATGDMRVFPDYLPGGCAYRPYSPDSRRGSGTARAAQRHTAIQPSTAARTWLRQRQDPDRVTGRLTRGQVPPCRTAPGSSRGDQCAGRRTGLRHGATCA